MILSILSLVAGIAAVAALITVVVRLTILAMDWISNKVKEKLRQRNTQKVAVGDLNKIIQSCSNQVSVDELERLASSGVSHVIADVDAYGNVGEVEGVHADSVETSVSNLIDKTGEGLVVIS